LRFFIAFEYEIFNSMNKLFIFIELFYWI
jgi:hypothetical protein